MFETDPWPFVPARWCSKWPVATKGRRPVRVIVIHDMEADESLTTAENVAHYFATTTTQASAHICVDSNSIIQCVKDGDIAWAAPGCNMDGIHIELAGYGNQSREQWLDAYGAALLQRGADAAAQYCLKYGILPARLTNAELLDGWKGIVGHDQVSQVYRKSDHTDPGPHFPWDYFIEHVITAYDHRSRVEPPVTT